MPEVKTYYRAFTTDPLGQIDLIDSLKVENFTKVHFQILTDLGPTLTAFCIMGVITGLAEPVTAIVGTFPVGTAGFHDNEIHTFNVIGPELKVRIQGPPNTELTIAGWVFLH
jgi:hypothetical protein